MFYACASSKASIFLNKLAGSTGNWRKDVREIILENKQNHQQPPSTFLAFSKTNQFSSAMHQMKFRSCRRSGKIKNSDGKRQNTE